MTQDSEKKELIEEFQKYLEQSNFESFETNRQPDLNTLLGELVALKTEVKTESRQFKNTLDALNLASTTIENKNKALFDERAEGISMLEKQQEEMLRTMLLGFLDIYDRVALAANALQHYQPVKTLFKSSRKKDVKFIQRYKEGQMMTINRFEQFLQHYHVYSIDSVGKVFDPKSMQAIETECISSIENGRVVEEYRKGFLHKDKILRLAEVKVNKIS